jgi:ankyrin repeat protein
MYNKEEWINYIEYNNIEGIKYLLDKKLIDINIQDKNKNSILMCASPWNKIEMVKLLLNYKDINVNIQNCYGYTALMIGIN